MAWIEFRLQEWQQGQVARQEATSRQLHVGLLQILQWNLYLLVDYCISILYFIEWLTIINPEGYHDAECDSKWLKSDETSSHLRRSNLGIVEWDNHTEWTNAHTRDKSTWKSCQKYGNIGTRLFTSVDRRRSLSGGLNNDSNTEYTSGCISNAFLSTQEHRGEKITHLKRWCISVKTCQQSRLEAVNYQSATSDWWLKVHQLQGHQTMLQVRELILASLAFQGHLQLTPYGPWRNAYWWNSKSDFYQVNDWLTLIHWRKLPGPR